MGTQATVEITHEQLAERVKADGPIAVARIVRTAGVVPALLDGEDWTAWAVQSTGGAFLFFRMRGGLITAETRVLAVNAPEADRAKWEAVAAAADAPVIVVMAVAHE